MKLKTEKMDEIKELEDRVKALNEERNECLNKIDELKDEELLPKLKEKILGKCFCDENRYSTDERWSVYYYVKSLESSRYARVISFQTDCYGKLEIEDDKQYHVSLLDDSEEIPREIFEKEFKSQIDKMTVLFF